MHPQIVQEGPGHCPICGMALEPMGVPPEHEHRHPELVDFTRRLKVGVPLSLALVALDMGAMSSASTSCPSFRRGRSNGCKLAIAIPAVLWCGWPFFVRGFASLRSSGSICSP